jgi:hypothetical protein
VKSDALNLAIATLMADVIKDHRDHLRQELVSEFEELGADSTKVKIDDQTIGKVSLVEPRPTAGVLFENLFFDWVKENYQSEIVLEVRESFKKHVLENIVFEGDQAILKTTGEVVPGIGMQLRSKYVSMRFEKTGRDELANALRNDRVAYNLPVLNVKQSIASSDE